MRAPRTLSRSLALSLALSDIMDAVAKTLAASTLTLDKVPLIEDPGSAKLLAAHRRRRLQVRLEVVI